MPPLYDKTILGISGFWESTDKTSRMVTNHLHIVVNTVSSSCVAGMLGGQFVPTKLLFFRNRKSQKPSEYLSVGPTLN